VEKITTHFVFKKYFLGNRAVYGKMWKKTFRQGQVKEDNIMPLLHVGCLMLHTNTLTVCNNYCFSTATMGTRTRLKVTLYLHWLSYSRHGTTTHDRNRGPTTPIERFSLRSGHVTSQTATKQQGRILRFNNTQMKELRRSLVFMYERRLPTHYSGYT
jgi:hypothetical protein